MTQLGVRSSFSTHEIMCGSSVCKMAYNDLKNLGTLHAAAVAANAAGSPVLVDVMTDLPFLAELVVLGDSRTRLDDSDLDESVVGRAVLADGMGD